jgi:hypothetical protein
MTKQKKRMRYTTTSVIAPKMPVIVVIPSKVRLVARGLFLVVDQYGGTYAVLAKYLQRVASSYPNISEEGRGAKEGEKEIEVHSPLIVTMAANVKSFRGDRVIVVDQFNTEYSVIPDHIHFFPSTYPNIPFKGGKIYTEEEGDWVCTCGNTPSDGGFSWCDAQGNEVEPLIYSGCKDLYVCNECGNIVHNDIRQIMGKNAHISFLIDEEQ